MNNTRGGKLAFWTLAAGLMLGGAQAHAEAPATIEEGLQKHARQLIDHARKNEWKNVGVLKFLVRRGKGPLKDNVGPLNLTLPDRLEAALILELSRRDRLGVISRASEAVAGNRRVSHLTEEGRMAFFQLAPSPFRLAWGPEEPVTPHGFFTGEVTLAPDLSTLTIKIQAFGQDQLALTDVCTFTARTDLRTLTEAGISFAGARGADFGAFAAAPSVHVEKTVVHAGATYQSKNPGETLLEEMNALPVRLNILYDDSPQAIQVNPILPPSENDNVLLRVDTPQPGQRVAFQLENTSASHTYAVVLMLNGENTIFKEKKAPTDCYKWILGPGVKVVVRGFQKPDFKEREDFRVLSPEESAAHEVSYGQNAGTISFIVFKQATTEMEQQMVKAVKEEEKKVQQLAMEDQAPPALIGRGMEDTVGEVRPHSLVALKAQLHQDLLRDIERAKGSRGMVASGDTTKSAVREEKVELSPLPIFSATIRYYRPQS